MNSRSLILIMLLAASLLVGACSDEPYGSLYCPPGPRDTLVVCPRLELQHVRAGFDNNGNYYYQGMAAMQSLYLGSSGDTQSDILVNFDFGDWRWNEGYPDSLFDPAHIKKVYLALTRLRPYSAADTVPTSAPGIAFVVMGLESPSITGPTGTGPGPRHPRMAGF